MREIVSSYTIASIIERERQEHLRDAILILCSELKSLCVGGETIRVDPAPGFSFLFFLSFFHSGIHLEVGRSKNPNKNPVAERAVAEVEAELLKLRSEGGPETPFLLAHNVAHRNSRIRRDGLSAREIWTQRDQVTGDPLPIVDRVVMLSQNAVRKRTTYPALNQRLLANFLLLRLPSALVISFFLKYDKDKTKANEKYLVTAIDNSKMCHLQKFTYT